MRIPRLGERGLLKAAPLCWCWTSAVANRSCLDVVELLHYIPAGSEVVGSASRGSRRGRWPAGGRGVGARGRGDGSAPRPTGGKGSSLEGAGVELDASEVSGLTERTEGWPAGLSRRCRYGGLERDRQLQLRQRRRPVRIRVLAPRASRPVAGGRRRSSSRAPRCWGIARAAVFVMQCSQTVGTRARDARVYALVVRLDRRGRSGTATTTSSASPSETSSSTRSHAGACAQRSCNGLCVT